MVSVENVEVFSRKLLCRIKRACALLIDNVSLEIIYSGKFSSDIKLLCARPKSCAELILSNLKMVKEANEM